MNVVDVDRYDRVVGRVYADGVDVNAELVRQGLAWANCRYARDQVLYDLEESARAAMAGLWADPDPVPPWEWRRGVRGRMTSLMAVSRQIASGAFWRWHPGAVRTMLPARGSLPHVGGHRTRKSCGFFMPAATGVQGITIPSGNTLGRSYSLDPRKRQSECDQEHDDADRMIGNDERVRLARNSSPEQPRPRF